MMLLFIILPFDLTKDWCYIHASKLPQQWLDVMTKLFDLCVNTLSVSLDAKMKLAGPNLLLQRVLMQKRP